MTAGRFLRFLSLISGMVFLAVACNSPKDNPTPVPEESVTTNFNFEFQGNERPLQLGVTDVITLKGDTFKVNAFSIYLSNIRFIGKTETFVVPDSYHFLNLSRNSSEASFSIPKIKKAIYDSIEICIGVDSFANTSLDHVGKGDLNTLNGMSWDWQTGYKFILLEGGYRNSPKSGPIVFHIGTNANFKKLKFKIPDSQLSANNKTLNFAIEASALFGNPNPWDLKEIEEVMFNATHSAQIAENYASGMLKLKP